jgi:DNA-directed RNA polymerase subunit H
MLQECPPFVVIGHIRDAFFRYRGLAPAPRGLGHDPIPTYDADRVIGDMEQTGYVRLDATRTAARGTRSWVVVLVLGADGKFAQHGPDLRRLIESIENERPAKDGLLDELVLVAEKPFFFKKNLTDVVEERVAATNEERKNEPPGDSAGRAPFYTACPYGNFSCVIPEHVQVYPHRLLADAELADLRRQRIFPADMPSIFSTESPVVWLGGRPGQVVEIDRRSQTAFAPPYFRLIKAGSVHRGSG